MPAYRYELRKGDEVVATGHITSEHSLEVGETLAIGSHSGFVRAIEPRLHERELQLIVQLRCDAS
jgi:hypothetical protein